MNNTHDPVNHPEHYTSHPSGVECIDITRHMTFNIGNVIKYCWRSGLKDGNPSVQDLRKAKWYLEDEIRRTEHILNMAPGEGIESILRAEYHNDTKSKLDEVAQIINEAVNSVLTESESLWTHKADTPNRSYHWSNAPE